MVAPLAPIRHNGRFLMSDDLQTERAVFRCSPALLEVIDRAAAASFSSRSDYIRAAVVDRLKSEGAIVNIANALSVAIAARQQGNGQ
jgi:metal-responsive CopG/Arc/MetJ family transcriptional regulator